MEHKTDPVSVRQGTLLTEIVVMVFRLGCVATVLTLHVVIFGTLRHFWFRDVLPSFQDDMVITVFSWAVFISYAAFIAVLASFYFVSMQSSSGEKVFGSSNDFLGRWDYFSEGPWRSFWKYVGNQILFQIRTACILALSLFAILILALLWVLNRISPDAAKRLLRLANDAYDMFDDLLPDSQHI